ncbi:MAG: hypothetical protein ACFFCM_09350 [Promethearchaeota archaeon]
MQNNQNRIWNNWTKKSILIVLLIFLFVCTIRFPFIFLFDLVFTKIGNFYVYIWALPEALILYFTALRLRIKWTSTMILGIQGIIGIPIDYYYEWVEVRNLISPWFAVAWGICFILMGLSADISLILTYFENKKARSVCFSSLFFTATVLLLTYLGNSLFYNINIFYLPYIIGPDWNAVAPLFIPYTLATGILGGYLGFFINNFRNR